MNRIDLLQQKKFIDGCIDHRVEKLVQGVDLESLDQEVIQQLADSIYASVLEVFDGSAAEYIASKVEHTFEEYLMFLIPQEAQEIPYDEDNDYYEDEDNEYYELIRIDMLPGFEDLMDWYYVDTNSEIWSNATGTMKKKTPTPNKVTGYSTVGLQTKDGKQKNCLVSRIAATAFIPNPNNLPWVIHKNRIRDDNAIDNLEWSPIVGNPEYLKKEVILINETTGEVMRFKSISECAEYLGVFHSAISYAIKHKGKTSKIYRPMLASEYDGEYLQ